MKKDDLANKYRNYTSSVKKHIDKELKNAIGLNKGNVMEFANRVKVPWKNGRDLTVCAKFNGEYKTFVIGDKNEFCVVWDVMSSVDFVLLGYGYEEYANDGASSKNLFIRGVMLPPGASDSDIAKVSDNDVKKFFSEIEEFNMTLNRTLKSQKVIHMHKFDNRDNRCKLFDSVYADTKNSYCPLYALRISDNAKGFSVHRSLLRYRGGFNVYSIGYPNGILLDSTEDFEDIGRYMRDVLWMILSNEAFELISK